MYFKNATIYTLSQIDVDDIPQKSLSGELDALLRENWLQPLSSVDEAKHGFASVLGELQDAPTIASGNCLLFCVATEKRRLPSQFVNRVVAKRAKKMAEGLGAEHLDRDAMRYLKSQVYAELLPSAPITLKRTLAYVDIDNRLLVVDTITRTAADRVASELRAALGTLTAMPLVAEVGLKSLFSGWLAGQSVADDMQVTLSCRLDDGGVGSVTMKDVDVLSEAPPLIEDGMLCSRIGLSWAGRMDFVIDAGLTLRAIKMLGLLDEPVAESASIGDDVAARFALFAGTMSALYRKLHPVLEIIDPEH